MKLYNDIINCPHVRYQSDPLYQQQQQSQQQQHQQQQQEQQLQQQAQQQQQLSRSANKDRKKKKSKTSSTQQNASNAINKSIGGQQTSANPQTHQAGTSNHHHQPDQLNHLLVAANDGGQKATVAGVEYGTETHHEAELQRDKTSDDHGADMQTSSTCKQIGKFRECGADNGL